MPSFRVDAANQLQQHFLHQSTPVHSSHTMASHRDAPDCVYCPYTLSVSVENHKPAAAVHVKEVVGSTDQSRRHAGAHLTPKATKADQTSSLWLYLLCGHIVPNRGTKLAALYRISHLCSQVQCRKQAHSYINSH